MKLMHLLVGGAMLAGAVTAQAQDAPRTYDDGPVWTWSMIEVKPGMGDAYLASLNGVWKAQRLARQKAGLETGYKMIGIDNARPGEANLILMIQYKNHAAFDASLDQIDAINKSVEAAVGKGLPAADRDKMRTILATQGGQEVVFKK